MDVEDRAVGFRWEYFDRRGIVQETCLWSVASYCSGVQTHIPCARERRIVHFKVWLLSLWRVLSTDTLTG